MALRRIPFLCSISAVAAGLSLSAFALAPGLSEAKNRSQDAVDPTQLLAAASIMRTAGRSADVESSLQFSVLNYHPGHICGIRF